MASNNKRRQRYLNWHKSYEKRVTKELVKTFRSLAKAVEFKGNDPTTFASQINSQIELEPLMIAYVKIYTEIGKKHGERVGKEFNDETKAFTSDEFLSNFEKAVVQYLHQFGLKRVVTVRKEFIKYITDYITKQMGQEWSIPKLSKAIEKMVDSRNFYRWQAERIARTETTAASNFGALRAGDSTGFIMEKEWLSGHDARTRRKPESEYDHWEMDGKKVGWNDGFIFNDGMDVLQYPGDPTGEAGNVINCRCSVKIVPKRDKDGKLIRKF